MSLPPDLIELLAEFDAAGVESLLIGGHALAIHARPRFTKDADVWIGDDPDNVRRACAALVRFGAPRAVVDALPSAELLDVVWMGEAPARIDLMKGVPGGDFRACWERRVDVVLDGITVHVVSREDLITLKEASGRPQDLLDAQVLRASV